MTFSSDKAKRFIDTFNRLGKKEGFVTTCLQCGSPDVNVSGAECGDCGPYTIYSCKACGAEYDTHMGWSSKGSHR